MVEMKCIFCGGATFALRDYFSYIVGIPEEGVYKCKKCGLMRRRDVGRSMTCSPEWLTQTGKLFEIPAALEQEERSRKLVQIEALLKRRGKLLEIGPGMGSFAKLAADRGWKVTVIEADGGNVGILEQVCFGAVLQGEFDGELSDSLKKCAPFDAIYSNHVMEHVANPMRFLNNAHALLQPNGVLLMEVPNEAASTVVALRRITGRWAKRLSDRRTQHNYFFRPRVIFKMLAAAGFSEIKVETPESRVSLHGASGLIRLYRKFDSKICRGTRIVFSARARSQRQESSAAETVSAAERN
jgi:2-polyprenyl-3-methyl-5-hydroxy-6-metoxy-1,4-benzoquinol methylase